VALTPAADENGSDVEAVLRTLFEQSVAGIYIIGLDGTIKYINAGFAELCDSTPSQMIGHVFFEYMVEDNRDARRAAFARLVGGEVALLQTVDTFKRSNGGLLELLTESSLAQFEGEPVIIGIAADVGARREVERALERANHSLRTLSAGKSALLRAQNESDLLQAMCDVAVDTGTYVMAWAGIAQHDADKTILPVARAGAGIEYLDVQKTSWGDSELGRALSGTAIRTGAPAVNRDFENNPAMAPWLEVARRAGFRSSLALPLTDDAGVFGSFTLYAREPDAFDEAAVGLLTQLASDISFGVGALRNRAALRAAEQRYRDHAARLEALWKIVNNPHLTGDDLTFAMLSEATNAIRPGLPYLGGLFRINAGEAVVEAVAETREYTQAGRGAADIRTGLRVPVAGTALEPILELGNGTQSWNDLQAAFATPRIQAIGWKSAIVTTFESGRSTYMLWFVSICDTGAWEPQDRAYVEVVSSFFSSHAQMRWQFDQLQYHQTHDVLTGMLNRSQFRSQARMASIGSKNFAVITLNVNAFGEINETYSNMIGDALLVEVAAGVSERTAPGEIAGRLGSDVFAVFIPDPRSSDFVRERAVHFAERFRHGFSTGDREGTEFIALTASFGMAVAPEHGTTLDTIISHASVAVSAAKARGRGTMLFYEPGMEGDAERNIKFRNELADAIAGDQFELYFQPHMNLLTGETSGCEALIRWQHPERGLILPGHFIPTAERLGLIADIDDWVLREALSKARELARLRPDLRLYFNLSGRQAGDPKLVDSLKDAAADGLSLHNIGIEITETDAMRDFEATRKVCVAVRELGVRVAIDDFGTGYSSLSSLKRLPVDVVKIDRSFISGILNDRHDQAIVETIIQMTRLFECDVLAEGVEQEGEMDWLRRRSCKLVQGYFVSHPLPIDAFKAWLAQAH
jgi:diguanylate cyclase